MQIKGVSESVEQRLREDIMVGNIAPGCRINEIEFSERFGVSRPPLREALRKLESENLIVSIPRKGSYVTEMSLEDCMQIYRARVMLECGALDIIGERGDADLSAMERALETEGRMHGADVAGTVSMPEYHRAMSEFHNALVRACCNRWVIHYHGQLLPTLGRYQIMYLSMPGVWCNSHDEHMKVYDLVLRGRYQDAKESIRRHIIETREKLVQSIVAQ